MKTLKLRVWSLGLVLLSSFFNAGCHEERARADVPVFPAPMLGEQRADLPPIPLALPDAAPTNEADVLVAAMAADPAATNAPVNPPRLVQEPIVPENLKVSPALGEVVKLVQAGVSEDVILSYITNSTVAFNADSDTIVYLNDLGVSTPVITAIIQHDSSPEMQAKRSVSTAQGLPPGVALTTPATNVYPPASNVSAPAPSYAAAPEEAGTLPPSVETAPVANESVTVNYFYDSLAPYGTWVDVDGYGLCWRPTVAVADPYWRPYSHRGRWLWSDAGWYWYSDYSWGWAPFHYGRWCSYPRLGWIWVPDTVWGPSWVTWRYSSSYCGWAPLPPGCRYSGGGLYYYNRHVGIGFDFGLGYHHYSYVPISRFCDWHPSRHVLPLAHVHNIHKHTTIVNNYGGRGRDVVNRGVDVDTIGKAVRTKIPKARIREEPLQVARTTKPERVQTVGSSLAVVRPQLPKNPPAFTAGMRSSGQPRVRPAASTAAKPPVIGSVARPAGTPTIGGNLSPQGVAKGEQPAASVRNPLQPRERRDSVTVARPQATTPPVITGNNTPQNARPNSGIGSNVRDNVPRNPARPEGRNPVTPGAVARINPQPGTVSPLETPRPSRSEATPRNQGILVRPFSQPSGGNAVPAPRVNPVPGRSTPNAFGHGNDAPIRSFANPPAAAPPAQRPPVTVPNTPRATVPQSVAPRAFTPAPAPRVEVPRPQVSRGGGGFGGAVSPAPRAQAPAVSAPAPSARPSGGGGNGGGGGRSGGGGGNAGGGKGGRGRE